MITLLTGAPGTGKTAALVDLLRTVGADRPLFVFGLNGLKLAHVPLEDPTKWMDEVPDGAAIVIDEVQQVWRPRGAGKSVPDHIAALETHRHRGLDFFLTTQGPNLLDSNVRALVGRHIHLRDLGWLGRWWYEWPECADQCRTGWRSAPIKKRYKLPKRIFDSYTSASIHIKPIRSFPTALVVAVTALGGTGYLAWHMYGRLASNMDPTAAGVPAKPAKSQAQAEPAKPAMQAGADRERAKPLKVVSDDPMAERGLHLLGCAAMGEKTVCTLAVSQGGQPAFTVTNRDLEEMGYKFARNGECIVTVTWKGVVRTAICDLPHLGQGGTMLASAALQGSGAPPPSFTPPRVRVSPEAVFTGGNVQASPQQSRQPQQPRSQWEQELAARNAQVRSSLTR
ncbi:zonular occludens toxin family protein [Acidovorax sp. SDU_ACID1]|uniref:zonular occludens toxin family protein n=1 Tax=Acidovorax sp. SDU_ACID1 TaxID=3136632 RepID=UPI0038733067